MAAAQAKGYEEDKHTGMQEINTVRKYAAVELS